MTRSVADSGVIDILQSLRHIKHGLEGAEASEYFSNHRIAPCLVLQPPG